MNLRKVFEKLSSGPAAPLTDRIARCVAISSCVWFALAAGWGLFGPITAGHYAAMASEGVMADNMWRWHILGPVWSYLERAPTPADYYCHHPWGLFWITAILYRIFGHHDFILPLPAVLMSAATVVLLYKIAKDAWGAIPGAAAAVGFSLLPITLGFANFHSLEVIVMFGCTLFFWGFTRMCATGRRRWLAVSLIGVAFATAGDWPGYLAIAAMLGWGLLRIHVLPARWFPRVSPARYTQWWALTATISVLGLAMWIALFHRSGKIGDWLGSAAGREGHVDSPLAVVLETRQFWIESAFTPLVILLGKIAAPIVLVRALVRRREVELFSLAALFMATVQYVAFKEGADVHFFWPQYFGLYFALAFAQLVATLAAATAWLVGRERPQLAVRAAAGVALGAVLLVGVSLVPDAVRSLRYARETGGRFNEKGRLIDSELDLVYVARWLRPQLAPGASLTMDPGFSFGWHHAWALRGTNEYARLPPKLGLENVTRPFWIGRLSRMSEEEIELVLAASHARVMGDLLVVDTREGAAPLDANGFVEREPKLWERYFVSGVEPIVDIDYDPFATWEWRTHFGQSAQPPQREPATLDQVRIAYNLAVSQGDAAATARLRGAIEQELDRSTRTAFTQGVTLIGTRVTQGVHPMLEAWFEASGPLASYTRFAVHSRVARAASLSHIPADPVERDCALPPALPTSRWRPGFLYVVRASVYHRIGDEAFYGSFSGPAGAQVPERTDGTKATHLALVR